MEKAVFIGADTQAAEVARLGICLRWPSVTVTVTTNATEGLDLVKEERPDLVLIRPDFTDQSMAEAIRKIRIISNVPLIVLNDQGNDLEGFTALAAGADEYVQLPCDISELTFKIWSLLRRTEMDGSGDEGSTLASGELKIDAATHQVSMGNRELTLTPVEFQLTLLLVKNCGNVISRETIEREISKSGLGKLGSLKQHVMHLRRKLEDNARKPRWIVTVPGVGYRFIGPAPK